MILAAAIAAAYLSTALPPTVTGAWSGQTDRQELVLRPQIKLRPYVAPGVTNLGGTAGYGSATVTTVETAPTPVQVRRRHALTLSPGGAFRLTTTETTDPQARCPTVRTTERSGAASFDGATLTLRDAAVQAMEQAACGEARRVSVNPETLRLNARDGRLHLEGAHRVALSRAGR
ncbi:MAG TPA: hypothetical protein VLZ51_06790 [Brevundimonas sp.]|jgi:hypothetical protein|nr:hypothetical protein [Brevundimonas sp.]